MNNHNEPRRLFESDVAPTGLRVLLEQAHADMPSEATVQQLVQAAEERARIETPSLRQGGSWVGRHAGKLVLVAVLAGVGGWYGATQYNGHHAAPSPAPILQTTPPLRPQVVAAAPEEPASTLHNEAPLPEPVLPVTKPSPRSRSRAPHPGRIARATPVLPETTTVVAMGTDVGMGSADEYRLLRSARQALAVDSAKALDLTQEHVRRFPHGMLTQEREAIAVEALVQLGRPVQAKTRGQAFLAAYPVSPYRSRVEHALSRLFGAAPKP